MKCGQQIVWVCRLSDNSIPLFFAFKSWPSVGLIPWSSKKEVFPNEPHSIKIFESVVFSALGEFKSLAAKVFLVGQDLRKSLEVLITFYCCRYLVDGMSVEVGAGRECGFWNLR